MAGVLRTAQAGTLESNDIMITIMPGQPHQGVTIEMESIVLAQYGEAIRRVITETLTAQGIDDASVKAIDRGALDCTIRARVMTALVRGGAVLKEDLL